MGTKRLKRRRREMVEERVRLLAQSTTIVSNGVSLKPGTAEHRQALEKMASMLGGGVSGSCGLCQTPP